jgi:hypothetical protein
MDPENPKTYGSGASASGIGTVLLALTVYFIFSGKANPDSLLILLEAANQVLLFRSLTICNFNHTQKNIILPG